MSGNLLERHRDLLRLARDEQWLADIKTQGRERAQKVRIRLERELAEAEAMGNESQVKALQQLLAAIGKAFEGADR